MVAIVRADLASGGSKFLGNQPGPVKKGPPTRVPSDGTKQKGRGTLSFIFYWRRASKH